MRYSDERAANLLARLLTYSPRSEKREELENYCTEALAWCVIKSELFANSLLNKIRLCIANVKSELEGFSGQLQVDTQIGFAGDDLLQMLEEGITVKGGRFDLLLSPKNADGFLIAIEVKTSLDDGLAEQVDGYIKALREPQVRSKYRHFRDSYVVTLTPARREITKADAHLSWGDIRRLMLGCGDGAIASELLGFAQFLELRHLSPVDMPPLTRDLRQNLAKSAPFLEKAKGLFNRFENDRILRTFFRPVAVSRPSVGFDENITWYGIWDTRNKQWAYAGFFIKGALTGLYVDTEYPGDRRDECAKLGEAAKAALKEAGRLIPEGKSNRSSGTWLCFACELDRKIMESNESSDHYLRWFTEILSDVRRVFG